MDKAFPPKEKITGSTPVRDTNNNEKTKMKFGHEMYCF